MLFDSPLQLLVLCAVVIGGWLLGFLTNPTMVHHDKAMHRLNRDFVAFRTQSQNRLNTLARHAAMLEATHQTMAERLSEAEARIAAFKTGQVVPPPAETERGLEADDAESLVPPLTAGESAAPPIDAETLPDLVESDPAPIREQDRLTRIDGIDAMLDQCLSELGITRFEDIEKLSDQDEMALELRLALPAGYITGRQWRQQAARLRVASEQADADV